MAQNGGIIGPVKCVSTPTTKNTTVTGTGCFTRHNCTVSSANVLVIGGCGFCGVDPGPENSRHRICVPRGESLAL